MHRLLLFLALQAPSPEVRANGEDTSVARAALRAGLAALDTINAASWPPHTAERFLTQLHLWGMREEGGAAAVRFDESETRLYRRPSHRHTHGWLTRLFESGDTAAAYRMLDLLPATQRDEATAAVARTLVYSHPDLSAQLERRVSQPGPRAEVHVQRALYAMSSSNNVAARAALVEAISLSRGDSTANWTRWIWMVDLLRLGGDISVEEIVQEATASYGDLWHAQHLVADALIGREKPELARPLIDSLEAGIALQSPTRRPSSRIMLHQLRRTTRDSALAQGIRDSLEAATALAAPAQNSQRADAQRNRLQGSLLRLDTSVLRLTLFLPEVHDEALFYLLFSLRAVTSNPPNNNLRPLRGDSLRAYARLAVAMTEEAVRSRPAAVRDSMQVYRVAVLAFLDAQAALLVARTIPTPRFRERATAEVIAKLARIDSDGAMREAASLRDSTARAVAYGPLALTTIAGGRLALAETLAERASGEPRVRAFHELAASEREHGLLPEARRHITSAVEAMDPAWRCDGCIVVVTAPAAVAPIPSGMERRLIGDVVFLALQLDLRAQLLEWAAAQRGSAQRPSAYLAIAEGMSRLLLGWRQQYPMH